MTDDARAHLDKLYLKRSEALQGVLLLKDANAQEGQIKVANALVERLDEAIAKLRGRRSL